MLRKWIPLTKLNKTVFKATKTVNPIEGLHNVLASHKDTLTAKSIMDFAMSEKTDDYFRDQIEKYVRKNWDFMSDRKVQSEVGMAMLQYSPCRVEGLEDFTVYVDAKKLKNSKKEKKNA